MRGVPLFRTGFVPELANQVPGPMETKNDFLPVAASLGNLHAAGNDHDNLARRSTFGENGGVAREMNLAGFGKNDPAVRSRDFRENFEALDGIDAPLQDAGDGRTV